MPHRVAAFIRSSTTSLEKQVLQVIHLKKTKVRSRAKPPASISHDAVADRPSRCAERQASSEATSAASTAASRDALATLDLDLLHANIAAVLSSAGPAMGPPVATASSRSSSPRSRPRLDALDREHSHHRLSFPALHLGRPHKDQHANQHAQVSWKIESPPILFHGDAENSTGALVSGQLYLDIKDDAGYEIDSFKATLHIRVAQKKPFTPHCPECTSQLTQLKQWVFLAHPVPLRKGVHHFPFSVLLDGHLPATLDSPLVSITYEFKAEAIPAASAASAAVPIRLEKRFDVKRSLPPPERPHHSLRVFPPTNIKASVHYQQVIHPVGTNTLTMRLDGLSRLRPGLPQITEHWKLRKLTWRLEETLKTIAPACDKHKPATDEQQKRGIARTETRVIGEKTLFSGWKSSYSGPADSHIELELDYALSKHAKFSCDLQSRDGTEVSHQLMLEMVVAQECTCASQPGLVALTTVGHILRMHFGTILTERGGIGISWDNEAPPIYQDVPPSPPAYGEAPVGGALDGLPDIRESLDAAPGPSGTSGTSSGFAGGTSSGRSSPERLRAQ